MLARSTTSAPRPPFSRTQKSVALAAAATVLLGGGVAYAFWTATGAGTGTATAGTGAALTAVQTSVVTGLAPGGAAQVLSGNFNNPNPSPVEILEVTAAIANVVKADGAPAGACAIADFFLDDAGMFTASSVPSGVGVGSWGGVTIQLLNTGLNQDGCKGATVNLTYTIS